MQNDVLNYRPKGRKMVLVDSDSEDRDDIESMEEEEEKKVGEIRN